jgi:hypothetical protein
MAKKIEMYIYTNTEVKAICWKLIESFTNPEHLNDSEDYRKDFERWFKQNKKNS